MNRSRLAALLLFVALALPLLASDTSSESLARNARLLATWKTDPEHYARLQRDGAQFAALPPDKQEQLRQFDRELHEEDDPETRTQLWTTLERYVVWLDQLPAVEQQQILTIADKKERIKAIKLKRQQQWLARQPAKEREKLEKLSGDARAAALARMYRQDLKRRQKWLAALKLRPDPRPRQNRLATLPKVSNHELRAFIYELSHDDLKKLNLSPLDPSSRERLRQEYFRRHPGELKRWRDREQRKRANKPTL